jgi:hypothetical protein
MISVDPAAAASTTACRLTGHDARAWDGPGPVEGAACGGEAGCEGADVGCAVAAAETAGADPDGVGAGVAEDAAVGTGWVGARVGAGDAVCAATVDTTWRVTTDRTEPPARSRAFEFDFVDSTAPIS